MMSDADGNRTVFPRYEVPANSEDSNVAGLHPVAKA